MRWLSISHLSILKEFTKAVFGLHQASQHVIVLNRHFFLCMCDYKQKWEHRMIFVTHKLAYVKSAEGHWRITTCKSHSHGQFWNSSNACIALNKKKRKKERRTILQTYNSRVKSHKFSGQVCPSLRPDWRKSSQKTNELWGSGLLMVVGTKWNSTFTA